MSTIRITLAFANTDEQQLEDFEIRAGLTLGEVLQLADLRSRFPDVDFPNCPAGLFGRRAHPDTPLRNGDRIELYRPLNIDPKEVRRSREKSRKARTRRA